MDAVHSPAEGVATAVATPRSAKARITGRIALAAMLVQGAAGMCPASAAQSSDVLWSYPADQLAGVPDHLVVTGTKEGGIFKPTGLSLPDPPQAMAHRRPFPFDANLLSFFQVVPFGTEKRVKVSTGGKGIALSCATGTKPAGLILKAAGFRYPRAMHASLMIEGQGPAVFSFAVVSEGEDAPSTAPVVAHGRQLAAIPAKAWASADTPKQLVVVCPHEGASVTLTGLRLVSEGGTAPGGPGTWLWDARPWLDRPDALVAELRHNGIRDLFLQMRIENGEIADEPRLVSLLTALSKAGIAVRAVEGDADMASATGRAHALERARVLREFKERTGVIRSFQYDIEPYLRPGFAADPVAGWQEWATTINALADTTGEKVSVVVPFWMLDAYGGERALQLALGAIADITVMAYRTDSNEVERIAGGWLDWGADNDLPTGIALENGPLSSEFVRTYRRSARGNFVLDRSKPQPVVRMLGIPVADSYTKPTYSFTQEMEIDPARISFLDDRRALSKVRERVRRNLAAWASFRGLMIHGLITPGG